MRALLVGIVRRCLLCLQPESCEDSAASYVCLLGETGCFTGESMMLFVLCVYACNRRCLLCLQPESCEDSAASYVCLLGETGCFTGTVLFVFLKHKCSMNLELGAPRVRSIWYRRCSPSLCGPAAEDYNDHDGRFKYF